MKPLSARAWSPALQAATARLASVLAQVVVVWKLGGVLEGQGVGAGGVVVLVPELERGTVSAAGAAPRSMKRMRRPAARGGRPRQPRCAAPGSALPMSRRSMQFSVSLMLAGVSVERGRTAAGAACDGAWRNPQRVLREQLAQPREDRSSRRLGSARARSIACRRSSALAPRRAAAAGTSAAARAARRAGSVAARVVATGAPLLGQDAAPEQHVAAVARGQQGAAALAVAVAEAHRAAPAASPARLVASADPPVGRQRVEVEADPLLELAEAEAEHHVHRVRPEPPGSSARAPRRSGARCSKRAPCS